MKRIAILGSTGSIGRSTLSVVESYPERFQIVTLAAGQQRRRRFRAGEALETANSFPLADGGDAEILRRGQTSG